MQSFNWFFDKDRYTVYKTFKHDSSVVYRMTTWTNLIAYTASWFTPTKVNVIFLKVQSNSLFPNAYDALSTAGLKLDPNSRNGLDDSVGKMAAQKAQFWNTVAGRDIKTFCAKNQDQLEIAVEEIGHLRIFYIVWEPDRGKQPRTGGFREFAAANFKAQLTHSEWEKALRGPIKWLGGQLIGLGSSD
ncbi:hypothetical protein B0T10DRAFT_571594 [Thelonectria olida]|uniref:Uncharacterized protein n=1 Tax=Thelonectria olida TaxID=1576542 RepID=A0A9P9AQD9_9HYPO|nr:hypothetical protein B0T10DRAFT_571594 [Thelonectria olida]